MAGYTRQSTFTDGDIINAADSNDEFNQLINAFSNTTGHAHDGTADEGPVIGLIGDPGVATPINKVVVDDTNNQIEFNIDVSGTSTEQFVVKDGVIEPTTDNDIDLGSTSKEFKNLYLDGTATIDGLAMPTTTVTDILDEDTMSSDSATALATQQSIKAYVDAQVTAQDLDFQADSGGALNIDLDSESLTFTGGTGIDTSGAGNAVTFAIDSTVATLTGTQTLTNKTLTSAVLNGTISGTSIKDEDTMSSDSASHLATQQSIKAYVDAQVATKDALSELSGDSDDITEGTTNLFFTNERVDDRVDSLLTAGTNITLTYDDTANTLTIASTDTGITDVVDDTTPQLGGDLDVNGNSIVSASNGDIAITPNGTGSVVIDGLSHPQADGSAGQFLKTDGAGQLAFATISAATGNELENVVEDTTPQLGGVLDTNGNNIEFGDSTGAEVERLKFGAGDDISMYWDGTDGHLEVLGTLNIDGSGETLAKFVDDGAVELYYNNVKKIETTSGGISVTGDITVSGNVDGKDVSQLMSDLVDDTSPQLGGKLETVGNSIDFADNGQAIFGTGDDMKIYHDGTHSYILDAGGTGDLYLGSNSGVHLFKYLSSEKMLSAIPDGAVELYYDNSKKLETVTGGVTITGTATATAFVGDGSGLTNIPSAGITQAQADAGATALAIALG